MKYLSLTQIPCTKIIDNICDSNNLESLSISGENIPAAQIKKLQKAPHLTYFDISTTFLDEEQMKAIAGLKKLEVLSIRDSRLNTKQLNYFLAQVPLLKKLQLNGPAYENVEMHPHRGCPNSAPAMMLFGQGFYNSIAHSINQGAVIEFVLFGVSFSKASDGGRK